MAKIASQNIEVYIRQLLSETLLNDVNPQKHATDQKLLIDDNFKSTQRMLSEKSKDK